MSHCTNHQGTSASDSNQTNKKVCFTENDTRIMSDSESDADTSDEEHEPTPEKLLHPPNMRAFKQTQITAVQNAFKSKTVRFKLFPNDVYHLSVMPEAFKTLKAGRQLDYFIIDAYMQLLLIKKCSEDNRMIVIDSNFFEIVDNDIDENEAVEFANQFKIFDKEVVLWPVKLDGMRWILVVMSPQTKNIYFYDALADVNKGIGDRVVNFMEFNWKHQKQEILESIE